MKEYCLKHKKTHDYHSWKCTKDGWSCTDSVHYPEFVPQRVKDDRIKYASDIVQPFRDNKPSKEFINAHPKQAKKMFTDKQINEAKPVWKDVKGLERFR